MTAPPAPDLARLVVASGEGFRLRRKHESDLAQDYAWRRDPELARYDGRPITQVPFEEFQRQGAYDLRYESPWYGTFSIDDGGGVHCGNAMFYNVSAGRDRAEIGIMIGDSRLWGAGLGRRITVDFVRFLWANYPFRELYLHTLDWNERAARCFRASGFDQTARVYRDGTWYTRMEARREWWLLWDGEGRFDVQRPASGDSGDNASPRD